MHRVYNSTFKKTPIFSTLKMKKDVIFFHITENKYKLTEKPFKLKQDNVYLS